MLSPHPSYPLEMAAYGMSTISNTFANKDLSRDFANVVSLREASPAAWPTPCAALVDRREAAAMMQRWSLPCEHAFLGPANHDAVAADIAGWTAAAWEVAGDGDAG